MPITTTIDSEPWVPTGSPSDKDRKELGEVLEMWTSISPVCTVSTERHDQWNHDLLWRGHNFGLITQGMGMIGFTSKVCLGRDPYANKPVSISEMPEVYGGFCGYVSRMEAMVRQWPEVLLDAVGNIRLLYGKGEYGLIEFAINEVKFRKVKSVNKYNPRLSTWEYADLEVMERYTQSIVSQIDEKDDRKIEDEIRSLLTL